MFTEYTERLFPFSWCYFGESLNSGESFYRWNILRRKKDVSKLSFTGQTSFKMFVVQDSSQIFFSGESHEGITKVPMQFTMENTGLELLALAVTKREWFK